MTLKEMLEEVEIFGSGDVIDDRDLIISLANRALREIHCLLPLTKSLTINLRGQSPTVYYGEIKSPKAGKIILPLSGKAYSFRLCGKGYYSIEEGGSAAVTQFDTGNDTVLLRGFIAKGGAISFWSGFSFVIYDYCLFDDIYSANVSDIPDGSPVKRYDIRELCGDFLAFSSPPKDRYGNIIENCRLYDSFLEISSSFSDEITLVYYRLPKAIMGYEQDVEGIEVIDLPEEYKYLLFYLIWHLYWLTINETKAQIYKQRFDALVSQHKENQRSFDNSYVDINGWA